jgi:LPS export ABC transporter protein LptC
VIPRQWLYGFLVLLAVAGAGLAIFRSQTILNSTAPDQKEAAPSNTSSESLSKAMVGQNVSFTISEGAKKAWTFQSKNVHYSEDALIATLDTVEGKFYAPSGRVTATFKAPAGTYDQAKKRIHLTGGVTVSEGEGAPKSSSTEQQSLTSPNLTWASGIRTVVADGGVVLKHPNHSLSKADRCRFTLDFSEIRLEGHAQTQLSL